MMASHRPAESPPAPPPDSYAPVPSPTASTGRSTLTPSNFLVGFDWVLAFGVLAFGFLIASFAVKNADFWMHLATGRLLAEGKYNLGTDPFSFVGDGRTWINHSWLFDWLLYQLFKAAEGPGVLIAKAIAVAVTAGLLLLARKPNQPVFPSVVCVGLAMLGAAPRMVFQPTIASFLFLAVLLCILIRVPRRPGSWLVPGLIGGLFWLWANFDQWFFIGPALVLCYAAGQYVRGDEGEDKATLWKALAIGVLACMLNPHHVRVWVLPPELADSGLAQVFAKDPDFSYLFHSGVKDLFSTQDASASTYAVWALMALTLAGYWFNRRQASASLALVWIAALILALCHARAIAFFAIVSAPTAAVNLAAVARRLASTPMADGTVRTLHALRAGGRVACALGLLILIAMSYPGWLTAKNQQRRWKWDVEPNPSMERVAKRIHEWRTSGVLPPEGRLFNFQPEFANYLYWFAPGEKTYFDFRIGFHRSEAAEYTAIRRQVNLREMMNQKAESFDVPKFLIGNNIAFAVYAPANSYESRVILEALWADNPMTGEATDWPLWDVQGKAVVVGWTRQIVIPTAVFDRLRFDPLRTAYVDPKLIPGPTELKPPNPPADEWERFLVSPPLSPIEAEESTVLALYRQSLQNRSNRRYRETLEQVFGLVQSRLQTPALTHWLLAVGQNSQIPASPSASAAALLSVQSARRAILASPDHPDGYFALARAYADNSFLTSPDMREIVYTLSLARARARLANDPAERRATFPETEMLEMLYRSHMSARPPRLDLGIDTLRLDIAYFRRSLDSMQSAADQLPADLRDKQQAEHDRGLKQLVAMESKANELDGIRQKGFERYLIAAQDKASALDRAAEARRSGLYREAIGELKKAQEEFQKLVETKSVNDLPPSELAVNLAIHAELIELLWYDGKVEEASEILGTIDNNEDNLRAMDTPSVRDAYYRARQRAITIMFLDSPQSRPNSPHDANPAGHFRALRKSLALAVGDFERATASDARDAKAFRTEVDEFRTQNFPVSAPTAIPASLRPFDQLLHVYIAQMAPLGHFAPFLGQLARGEHIRRVEQLTLMIRNYAEQQVRIGLVYLEQGDVKSAAHYFEQAQKTPELTNPIAPQRMARDYLRAIEQATAKQGARP
jgi:tetratricopeptide (TPR) repeat protein